VAHVVECEPCWDSFAKHDVQGANFSVCYQLFDKERCPPAQLHALDSSDRCDASMWWTGPFQWCRM